MLPTGGCYSDLRGSAVITEYFARGTEPQDHCGVHRSWGGMIVPSGEEEFYTDDSRYRYKPEPETTAAAEEEEKETTGTVIDFEGPGAGRSSSGGPIISGSGKRGNG